MSFKFIFFIFFINTITNDHIYKQKFNDAIAKENIQEALNIIEQVKSNKGLVDLFNSILGSKFNTSVFEISADASSYLETINLLCKKISEINDQLKKINQTIPKL